jgi:hypothetical protein
MSEKATNTQIMMVAAAVMTRAEPACPMRAARPLSVLLAHSSFIRLTRNTGQRAWGEPRLPMRPG